MESRRIVFVAHWRISLHPLEKMGHHLKKHQLILAKTAVVENQWDRETILTFWVLAYVQEFLAVSFGRAMEHCKKQTFQKPDIPSRCPKR